MKVIKAIYQFLVGERVNPGGRDHNSDHPGHTQDCSSPGCAQNGLESDPGAGGALHFASHAQTRNRTIVLARWRPKEAPI
jgi:hypothetical protein